MQKAYFPMEVLRVTQGRDTGAHRGTFALDLGGKNTERDKVYAPCDMRIVRVRTDAGNNGEVYSESIEPVLLPGGGASALHFTFIHADSYKSNVWVGAVLPQGTYFYDEGGKAGGQPGVYAAHLHLEVGRGASPAKQVQNSYGCWMTPNTEPIGVLIIGALVLVVELLGLYLVLWAVLFARCSKAGASGVSAGAFWFGGHCRTSFGA